MLRNVIQVAGILDAAEAEMLIDCGVTHLGFPLRLPVHEEDLTDHEARAIIAALPASVCAVLITYLDEASEILRLCDMLGVSWVQLHGDVAIEELARLRAERPRLTVIKSLVVRGDDLEELEGDIRRYERWIDAFITDTFDPKTGASGATGKVHDWAIDRRLVERSGRPVIAAGGLHPGNVCDAICATRPAGVDVHTGVEGADGRKRREAVRAFVAEARRGFALVESRTGGMGPR